MECTIKDALLTIAIVTLLTLSIIGNRLQKEFDQWKSVHPIPTVREIQFMVGADQDGKIGPLTMEKWRIAVCNQAALPHMTAPELDPNTIPFKE